MKRSVSVLFVFLLLTTPLFLSGSADSNNGLTAEAAAAAEEPTTAPAVSEAPPASHSDSVGTAESEETTASRRTTAPSRANAAAGIAGTFAEATAPKGHTAVNSTLPQRFVSADLAVLRQTIDMHETDIVKYYDPDPEEFLPLYAPFLKMDIDTLFFIFETVQKYEWVPHISGVNLLENKGCEIGIVAQDEVLTYLEFCRDANGRCYVSSYYDYQVAYLSEEDYAAIRALFDAAPEWPEKYQERYECRSYRDYP